MTYKVTCFTICVFFIKTVIAQGEAADNLQFGRNLMQFRNFVKLNLFTI